MQHHYLTPELETTPAHRSLSAPEGAQRNWGEIMGLFPHFHGKQQPGTAPTYKQREEGLSWCTTGFSTASRRRKASLRALWRAPFWAQLTLQQEFKTQIFRREAWTEDLCREGLCRQDAFPALASQACTAETRALPSEQTLKVCFCPSSCAENAFHHSLWPEKLLHLSSPILTSSVCTASYSNSFFLAVNTAPSQSAEMWIIFKGRSQSISLWPSCHFPWWPLLPRGLRFTKPHLTPHLLSKVPASPSHSALPSCKRNEQN